MAKQPTEKKKTERKKREHTLLSQETLDTIEIEYSDAIQKALSTRDAIFDSGTDHSIDDLTGYLINSSKKKVNHILPIEKRRYVIYLRKSTDDESKQVRSIEDQEDECRALAARFDIHEKQITVLEDRTSAKTSGKRESFNAIMRGFETGQYHGLISWSPDRLSRNMKEAGEIIELIDREIIQDLKFCTYQFENSPNGKMMLGILFATSKQYSDKLGVDVKRGTDGNIKDGKYNGIVKKGYSVDTATNLFVPDNYNWGLLRAAVDMRLYENKNNVDIAKFLNGAKLSYRKDTDEDYKLLTVSNQMVGNIFEDSFYTGIYKYGNNIVNLMEIYNFVPLITPDEYIALNTDVSADFGKSAKVKANRNSRLDYGLLRNKVICDYCDDFMEFQHQELKKGKNKGKWLISYYCRNKSCLRHDKAEQAKQGLKLAKSIRAKYVMAAIEWTLRHATKQSEAAYRQYIERLEYKIASDRAILKRKLQDAKSEKKANEAKILRLKDLHIDDREAYERYHHGKIEHHEQLRGLADQSITDNQNKLKELNTALPTEEEFYELINLHLLDLLELDDIVKLDAICNEFVTNLRAGNDSVSVIKLNPPYDLMVDLGEISLGWASRTIIEL